MYVLTIDQRGSSSDADRVPDLITELAALSGARFERSVGDELQGVVENPAEAVDIALHALRSGHWYVGIGIGPVRLAPNGSPREGSGSGFVAARKAVDQAKAAGGQVPLSVVDGIMAGAARSSPAVREPSPQDRSPQERSQEAGATAEAGDAAANAQAVLRLIGRLVQDRTAAQWRVVDRLRHTSQAGKHGSQKQVARELGITEQSVSRAILRAGWQEEWAARPAAAMLLALAHSRTEGDA
ncbi:MarR family transcriptional regulator [Arthrobacter sp. BHU FT2]|nr:MarR family transcriptional regulator [Arthrobacter sp. BHU FT2]